MKLLKSAVQMAREAGVAPKLFREALRKADLKWHSHNARWEVWAGSAEHRDMQTVLERIRGEPSRAVHVGSY